MNKHNMEILTHARCAGPVLRAWFAAALAGAALSSSVGAELSAEIGKTCRIIRNDKFYGFDRTVFDFNGYEAWVVEPPAGKSRNGRPWTWTMQWATAFVPRTAVPVMLADGYHHVTINTFKDKMDETGLKVSAEFQKFLVDRLGFARKANLIGLSWGGFFSVRYAVHHPDNVRRIYLDCPLLCFQDIGAEVGTPVNYGHWKRSAPADGKWSRDPRMPVNMTGKLAETGIPVFLVYGGYDLSCPPRDNAEPFIRKFKAAGGEKNLKVLYRKAYGHHPHGLEVGDGAIPAFFAD